MISIILTKGFKKDTYNLMYWATNINSFLELSLNDVRYKIKALIEDGNTLEISGASEILAVHKVLGEEYKLGDMIHV